MIPSLRKACHACVKSKRRCIPDLPACQRCTQRQISCVYDLEPVVHYLVDPSTVDVDQTPSRVVQPVKIVYDCVSNARDAAVAALADGQSANSAAAHPLLMTDGEIAIWLMEYFGQVARDGLRGEASPFVHRRIIRGEVVPRSNHLSLEMNHPKQHEKIHELLTTLVEINRLTTSALERLLLEKASAKKESETERLVQCMFSTTQSLWSSAPENLNLPFLPPWDAWLVAESIRRSMFVAIFVRGIWSVAMSGYCHYEPFLESLPFDPRSGLWEASSEEGWNRIIEESYGGEHTELKSWHEFTEGDGVSRSELNPAEDGMFQRLLFVSFHGSNGIRCIEELEKQRHVMHGVPPMT